MFAFFKKKYLATVITKRYLPSGNVETVNVSNKLITTHRGMSECDVENYAKNELVPAGYVFHEVLLYKI